MKNALLMNFTADKENNKIKVDREFAAPATTVWAAWTQSELLDQWWAPKPWQARTKRMDFRNGGTWLYAMVGPQGEEHWVLAAYSGIVEGREFSAEDAFCDSEGRINDALPRSVWHNTFEDKGDSTVVHIEISYKSLKDLEATMEMGFKEGFTAGLENLDHYLETQFRLRKQNKRSHAARVSTYLNFPGNTEEAFAFYKDVFRGEYVGDGLVRFGDIPAPEGAPAMSEADKKRIIHAELQILGGHILMATDAPESMGFTLNTGNNMHINLEPESREETERLFRALSEGGEVSMPLQDMFWGAYFASFKDKYGINWMLNHQGAKD
ncbi:MAG: SRPBCC domain-containing protein [Flavobacteriales bacterium]